MQISYWLFFYVNVSNIALNPKPKKSSLSPVSIVLCAKNEADNITRNFSSWQSQLSAKDELIIVDDYSTDNTWEISSRLCSAHKNCSVIKATRDRPGKKQALADGINASTKNYILLTDTDCSPKKTWKQKLLQDIDQNTNFVLGYAPFYPKKTFINTFQRFECLLTAMQYFSYAHAGIPYMGVGRNLSFEKSIFDEKIYESKLASGDDDLLVSAKANKSNTRLCIHPESFVYSEAKPTFVTYFKQKLRHITSSTEYKPHIKILLALFSSTQIIIYVLLPIVILSPHWKVAIGFWILSLAIKTLTLKKTSSIFQEGNIYLYTPILDLCLTLYYIILALCYPFKKKTSWN